METAEAGNSSVRPRSALKRPDSLRYDRSVLWDEMNLTENEKLKAEYARIRINEPKTPYHGPLDGELEGEDLAPLALDEPDVSAAAEATANGVHEPEEEVTSMELEGAHSFSSQADSDGEGSGLPPDEFSKRRKSHYDMRNALARAKDLLKQDEGSELNPEERSSANSSNSGSGQV